MRHERANTTDGKINQNNNTSEQKKTIITTTWNETNTNIKDKKRKGDTINLNALKQPNANDKKLKGNETNNAKEAKDAKGKEVEDAKITDFWNRKAWASRGLGSPIVFELARSGEKMTHS
jgi:hypothetical protein